MALLLRTLFFLSGASFAYGACDSAQDCSSCVGKAGCGWCEQDGKGLCETANFDGSKASSSTSTCAIATAGWTNPGRPTQCPDQVGKDASPLVTVITIIILVCTCCGSILCCLGCIVGCIVLCACWEEIGSSCGRGGATTTTTTTTTGTTTAARAVPTAGGGSVQMARIVQPTQVVGTAAQYGQYPPQAHTVSVPQYAGQSAVVAQVARGPDAEHANLAAADAAVRAAMGAQFQLPAANVTAAPMVVVSSVVVAGPAGGHVQQPMQYQM